jgi:hypothetical protein
MQIVILNNRNNPNYLISPNFTPKELDSLKEMLYNESIKYILIYNEQEHIEYQKHKNLILNDNVSP